MRHTILVSLITLASPAALADDATTTATVTTTMTGPAATDAVVVADPLAEPRRIVDALRSGGADRLHAGEQRPRCTLAGLVTLDESDDVVDGGTDRCQPAKRAHQDT